MSIKDLLSKVNRDDVANPILTSEQVTNKLDITKENKLEDLSFSELLNKYTETRSWLETHECQTGTENKLDVHDRPYELEIYCTKLKELENITCEILSRPLTEGLEEQLRNYGL